METPDLLEDFVDEDIYPLILQSLEDGVYLVDTQRRVTYWNEGAERITGYLRQDAIGRRCQDNLLCHCAESGVYYCASGCPLAAAMKYGKSQDMDAFLRHHQGHRVPVHVRAAPVRNAAGEIIGAVEIFHVETRRHGLVQKFRGLERYGCLDPETGVGNREMTLDRLRHRLQDLRTFGIPAGLISIEFQGHEAIRSRCGHEAWLGLLRAGALTMVETMPPNGFLGRWDQNLFLALLSNCDPISLQHAADHLSGLVHATDILWWGDPLRTTVSVEVMMPEPSDTPEDVIRRLNLP